MARDGAGPAPGRAARRRASARRRRWRGRWRRPARTAPRAGGRPSDRRPGGGQPLRVELAFIPSRSSTSASARSWLTRDSVTPSSSAISAIGRSSRKTPTHDLAQPLGQRVHGRAQVAHPLDGEQRLLGVRGGGAAARRRRRRRRRPGSAAPRCASRRGGGRARRPRRPARRRAPRWSACGPDARSAVLGGRGQLARAAARAAAAQSMQRSSSRSAPRIRVWRSGRTAPRSWRRSARAARHQAGHAGGHQLVAVDVPGQPAGDLVHHVARPPAGGCGRGRPAPARSARRHGWRARCWWSRPEPSSRSPGSLSAHPPLAPGRRAAEHLRRAELLRWPTHLPMGGGRRSHPVTSGSRPRDREDAMGLPEVSTVLWRAARAARAAALQARGGAAAPHRRPHPLAGRTPPARSSWCWSRSAPPRCCALPRPTPPPPSSACVPARSLRELAEAAPEPWGELLHGHREAFLALTAEISQLAQANRDVLSAGQRATQEALRTLTEDPRAGAGTTYDPYGRPAAATAGRAHLVDEAL